MILPIGLWLWRDGGHIRWWSLYHQGYVDADTSPDVSGSLANILHEAAQQSFTRSLDEHGTVVLGLLDSLPDVWIEHRWEDRCLSDGRRIGDCAAILRAVSPQSCQPIIINPAPPMLLLRFHLDGETRKWKGKHIQRVLNEKGLHDQLNKHPDAPLALFAHGNDGEDRLLKPLKDESGHPWQWPATLTPPSIIFIFACDHSGHQRQFARWLLHHGAKSIVIATDLLNADSAWEMMGALSLARLKTNFSLANWVARQNDLELWGVDAVCIFGHSIFTRLKNNIQNLWSDHSVFALTLNKNRLKQQSVTHSDPIHGLQKTSEFPDHINQCEQIAAWLCLQAALMPQDARLIGSIARSANLWRDLYAVDKENEQIAQAWLAAMHQLLPQWRRRGWEEVICWVLPLVLDLTERHSHEWITFFRAFCSTEETAEIHVALAKVCYRNGEYQRSLWRISQAIDGEQESSIPLGTLLNILIDFNLPELGKRTRKIIEWNLQHLPEKELHGRQFKLLDQYARLSIRSGNIHNAIRCMKRKKEEKLMGDGESYREDAWLLFLYTWSDPTSSDTSHFVDIAQGMLKQKDLNISHGNSDHKYMAKALACWAWRTDDLDAASIIQLFWKTVCKKEYGKDSGPVGQAIAYIAMLEKAHVQHGWASEAWPNAREAMQNDAYWFETAILDHLLEEHEHAKEAYQQFDAMRQGATRELLKPSFSMLWKSEDVETAIQIRRGVEDAIFHCHDDHTHNKDAITPADSLVKSGILPL